ncbi:MAG: flagellar export chaperone FliS [Verrucomicrobiota bacterium]
MHVPNPWNSYRQVSTLTAPPGQIVLMLYDGALRFLDRSLTGFDQEDPAQANMLIHNNIQRAQDIIRELNYALNLEKGGECAATLRRLYDYFDRRLAESNTRKSRQGIEEVIRHLSVLRDAWATMLRKEETAAAPAPVRNPFLALATA